jgi:phenylalanyl-tRNA synthetase beta chain
MSSEMAAMRTTLLPGLVETLRANLSRQQERVRLFEVGLCFIPGEPVVQESRIGAVACGARMPPGWAQSSDPLDFFDIKGVVERLLRWGGHRGVAFVPARDPVLHPGQSAEVRIGASAVGRIGRLHPEIELALDLTKPVYIFELKTQTLLERVVGVHRGISRYPSVRRDLALLVQEGVAAAAVESVVRETLGEILTDFTLFDVYQGKGIDSNEKSLAVGLTLQDASATLTEDRIARCLQDVLAALERTVGARLRV